MSTDSSRPTSSVTAANASSGDTPRATSVREADLARPRAPFALAAWRRCRHVALQVADERAGLRVVGARPCALRGPQYGMRSPSVRDDSGGELPGVVGADERHGNRSHRNADPGFVALPA